MSKRQWIHLINPFEVNTRGSHRSMLSLTSDTHSKLAAEVSDPDILAIFNDYDPVHDAYVQIYGNYDTVAGIRKGKTLNLETLIGETLLTELRKWEGAVRNFYVEDSPQELAIFPNKRTPFIRGTYEERINAVNGLIGRLTEDGNFATLITQVQSFYNVLLAARDTQQQKEGLLGQLADLREQQRVLTAQALDGFVLCGLKRKYRSDLTQVERFFDLSLLRSTGDNEEILGTVQNTVAAGMIGNAGAVPEGTQKIRMTALVNGPLEFGLSSDGLTAIGNTTTLSAPGSTTYMIADFASTGTQMVVRNQNLTLSGEYKIEFLA